MDPAERRQIAKDMGNMVLEATGLPLRSNSDDSRRIKAALNAGTYNKVNFGLGTSHEANASQEIDDDETNSDDDLNNEPTGKDRALVAKALQTGRKLQRRSVRYYDQLSKPRRMPRKELRWKPKRELRRMW